MHEKLEYEGVEYLDEFLQEIQEENLENADSVKEKIIDFAEEELIDVSINY